VTKGKALDKDEENQLD